MSNFANLPMLKRVMAPQGMSFAKFTFCWCVLLFQTALLAATPSPPQVTVCDISPNTLAQIPWLATDKAEHAPLGQVNRPDGTPLVTISAGWNIDHLALSILVNDADHVPASDAQRLWSADSIEIGIDAAGDRSAGRPADTTGPIASDDFKFIFGLLADGPDVSTLVTQSKPDLADLRDQLSITRTDDHHTLYEIKLPWSQLNVAGGTHPTLGLDIQINDRNSGDNDKTAYPWGTGLRGGFTAAKLKPFALGSPAAPFFNLYWDTPLAWDSSTPLTLHAGLRSDTPASLTFLLGDQRESVQLPGGPGLRHYTVTIPAQPDGTALSASIPGAPAVTTTQIQAAAVYQRLQDRLAPLITRPGQHPLFTRHLQSLSDLAADDWKRTQTLKTTAPRRALESLDHYRDLISGLDADTADWSAYLDGRRSLVLAYTSAHDRTLQYYLLSLPRDWDSAQTYPLFFELHGAGNDHPMASFSDRLSASAKRQDGFGYENPKVYAEIERSGYWVHPFGRGNKGYAGIARIDVLEAYDHVHSLFKINSNRRYLYGFSMGGQGTFTLGSRTPSRWAAACSIAPGGRGGSAESSITDNWSLLPYKIQCGEDDSLFGVYQEILAALDKRDIHPEARSIPAMGHNYRSDLQQEKIEWLKSHVRSRPDTFNFVTDDNLTNSCWGVSLLVPDGATKPARVNFRRDGQTIHLTTEGTSQVSLDPSEPDGLGITGEITVVWNNAQAYTGPAKSLTLELPKSN